MTTWKDKLTTQKDERQSGETFDLGDSTPRINGFAPQIREPIATESKEKEKGSQDPRERREDKGSTVTDKTVVGLETNLDNGNGYGNRTLNVIDDAGLETNLDKGNGYGNGTLNITDDTGLDTNLDNGNGYGNSLLNTTDDAGLVTNLDNGNGYGNGMLNSTDDAGIVTNLDNGNGYGDENDMENGMALNKDNGIGQRKMYRC